MLRHVIWQKFTDVSEVLAASTFRNMIVNLMMQAFRTSETSVNFNYTTGRHVINDSRFHELE
jgi:hypothetical protein